MSTQNGDFPKPSPATTTTHEFDDFVRRHSEGYHAMGLERSLFFPRTATEYGAHRTAMGEAQLEEAQDSRRRRFQNAKNACERPKMLGRGGYQERFTGAVVYGGDTSIWSPDSTQSGIVYQKLDQFRLEDTDVVITTYHEVMSSYPYPSREVAGRLGPEGMSNWIKEHGEGGSDWVAMGSDRRLLPRKSMHVSETAGSHWNTVADSPPTSHVSEAAGHEESVLSTDMERVGIGLIGEDTWEAIQKAGEK